MVSRSESRQDGALGHVGSAKGSGISAVPPASMMLTCKHKPEFVLLFKNRVMVYLACLESQGKSKHLCAGFHEPHCKMVTCDVAGRTSAAKANALTLSSLSSLFIPCGFSTACCLLAQSWDKQHCPCRYGGEWDYGFIFHVVFCSGSQMLQ